MKLRSVTFANWLASHASKDAEERWLRELYPWPVLAQVEYDQSHVGITQAITHDEVEYTATLLSVRGSQHAARSAIASGSTRRDWGGMRVIRGRL